MRSDQVNTLNYSDVLTFIIVTNVLYQNVTSRLGTSPFVFLLTFPSLQIFLISSRSFPFLYLYFGVCVLLTHLFLIFSILYYNLHSRLLILCLNKVYFE